MVAILSRLRILPSVKHGRVSAIKDVPVKGNSIIAQFVVRTIYYYPVLLWRFASDCDLV